ncbi:MAG: FAD-dependent oxidoreductase [Armatimonadota bacterium]|jgi:alkyl hydroperoxide reductase subunit F|nr:thioredoxin-disulfide reductase [Armatimonadota bacterium]
MQDVIIIGGGPAAMTAAIYGARKKLDQIMIAPEFGGQQVWATEIENYLGFRLISGYDLARKFEEHVRDFGVPMVADRVVSLSKADGSFKIKTEGGEEYQSRAVIIASGRSSLNLGVPGEEEFKGKGMAYCATCDAPLFSGEDVAVAGGGNAGLYAVIQLAKIAGTVYLLEAASFLRGDKELQDKIKNTPNVKIFLRTRITQIKGDKFVKSICIQNLETGEESGIPVTGVFVEIGSRPNTSFLPSDVKLNDRGEVEVDCLDRTNVPGLYAAGDVTSVPAKQIIIAAGEGAKALLSAYEYLVRNFAEGV